MKEFIINFKLKYKTIINYYNRYGIVLKYVITFVLLAIIFTRVDIIQTIELFKHIKAIILIPFLLYLPALLLSTFKWQLILGGNIQFWYLFKIYWIGNFFSNFLPSTIGGDGYRVIKVTKKVSKMKVLSSIIFDRISGLIATIVLFLILSFLLGHYLTNITYYVLFTVFFLLMIVSYYLFVYLIDLSKFEIYKKIRELLIDCHTNWIKVFLISFIYLFFGVTSLWCYYFMFGYFLNFFIVTEFYLAIQLISLIPISINAIGVYEIGLIGLFSLVGVPAEISLAISLLSRSIMLIQTSVGGLIYLGDKEKPYSGSHMT